MLNFVQNTLWLKYIDFFIVFLIITQIKLDITFSNWYFGLKIYKYFFKTFLA